MMMTTESSTKSPKPGPRTCAGCGDACSSADSVRVVLGPVADGGGAELAVDLAGGAFGRGAHVHPRPACIQRAVRSGFARSFKTAVDVTEASFLGDLADACTRRLTGLLVAAHRVRAVAIGADAACESLDTGTFALLATDAGNVLTRPSISRAVSEGRAVAWSDKASLGSLFGRDAVAVLALENADIAAAFRATLTLQDEAGATRRGSGRANDGAPL